jgi:DNA-binding NarL/FixJ family response regulator
MFDWFRKSEVRREATLESIKLATRVLIIDDEEPQELRELLGKEGWKNFYLSDLDSLSNRKLVDSQVVCIDIMGVGAKLQCDSGMGLVRHIKDKYPEKKIILYSSVSQQDIFDEALDFVDKRLRKQASLLPFSAAVEEMAKKTFSLEDAISYAFSKLEKNLTGIISQEDFQETIQKSVKNNRLDESKFAKYAGVSLDIAAKVASLIGLALTTGAS